VQKEVDILILPAIERLKEKSRARDAATAEYLEQKRKAEIEAQLAALAAEEDED